MDSMEFEQWMVDLSICTLIRVDVGHWTEDLPALAMSTVLGVDFGCWTVVRYTFMHLLSSGEPLTLGSKAQDISFGQVRIV